MIRTFYLHCIQRYVHYKPPGAPRGLRGIALGVGELCNVVLLTNIIFLTTGEVVNEHFRNYVLASNDEKLSPEQKLEYLHNPYEGEGKNTINPSPLPKQSFTEIASKTLQVVCHRIRAVRISQYLQGLTLTWIMEKVLRREWWPWIPS